MKTSDLMLRQGNWLFKYRSYLPIIIILFALFSMWTQRSIYADQCVWFTFVCIIISLSGEVIRIIAVGYAADGTSGRNTQKQVAGEINSTGIYSLLRHPLYVGNFFIWLGIALYCRIWWLVVIFILIYWLYYERIIVAEENFLEGKFGEEFRQYTEQVNCIMPAWGNYKPNRYHFRIRKVLRQENASVYGIAAVYLVLALFQNIIGMQTAQPEKLWIITTVCFTFVYLILRFMKKKTQLLNKETMRQKNI